MKNTVKLMTLSSLVFTSIMSNLNAAPVPGLKRFEAVEGTEHITFKSIHSSGAQRSSFVSDLKIEEYPGFEFLNLPRGTVTEAPKVDPFESSLKVDHSFYPFLAENALLSGVKSSLRIQSIQKMTSQTTIINTSTKSEHFSEDARSVSYIMPSDVPVPSNCFYTLGYKISGTMIKAIEGSQSVVTFTPKETIVVKIVDEEGTPSSACAKGMLDNVRASFSDEVNQDFTGTNILVDLVIGVAKSYTSTIEFGDGVTKDRLNSREAGTVSTFELERTTLTKRP
jgi:hypothetical protein